MAAKTTSHPQAKRATQAITPVMEQFVKFIESETGYKVDPMSVQLGSLMRAEFQKSAARQGARAAVEKKDESTAKPAAKVQIKRASKEASV